MEMQLDMANREVEHLLCVFDTKESEYNNPSLAYWRKLEVKQELVALKDQLDAWQLYQYKVRTVAEILNNLQQLGERMDQRFTEAENRRQRELEAMANQAEIEATLKQEQFESEELEATTKLPGSDAMLKQDHLKIEGELYEMDHALCDVRKLFVIDAPNNGYDGFTDGLGSLFDEVVVVETVPTSLCLEAVAETTYLQLLERAKMPELEKFAMNVVFVDMPMHKFLRKTEVILLPFGLCSHRSTIQFMDLVDWPTGIGNFFRQKKLLWYERRDSLHDRLCSISSEFKNARVLVTDQVIFAIEGINLFLEKLQSLFSRMLECRVPPDKYRLLIEIKLGGSLVNDHEHNSYGFCSKKNNGQEIIVLNDEISSSTHKLPAVIMKFCKDRTSCEYQNQIMLVQTTEYLFRSYATLDYNNESRDLVSVDGSYSVSFRIQRGFKQITSQFYDTFVPPVQPIKKLAHQQESLRPKLKYALNLLPPSKQILGACKRLALDLDTSYYVSRWKCLINSQREAIGDILCIIMGDILIESQVNEDMVDHGIDILLKNFTIVESLGHACCLWGFLTRIGNFDRGDNLAAAVITDSIYLFDDNFFMDGDISCNLLVKLSGKILEHVLIKKTSSAYV